VLQPPPLISQTANRRLVKNILVVGSHIDVARKIDPDISLTFPQIFRGSEVHIWLLRRNDGLMTFDCVNRSTHPEN